MKGSHFFRPMSGRHFFAWSLLWLLTTTASWAQLGSDRKVTNALENGKWSVARQQLQKILSKDSTDTEAYYLLTRYFASSGNPDYQLDSAYQSINKTLQRFQVATSRQRERLTRVAIDSSRIVVFRMRIDSLAFEATRAINSERAYQHFVDKFVYARQKSEALELRNEVAFLEALRVNTIESYQQYLSKYPQSTRAVEANQRYEQLLFQHYTKDGKLAGYRKFLQDHPKTNFRSLTEQRIFEISTASGTAADYMKYLDECSDCPLRHRALNLLYYINRESGRILPVTYLNDSLRQLDQLKQGYVVPFLRNGFFGFMDSKGKEIMEAQFNSIDPSYLCGNLQQDYFLTSEGLFARSGIRLLNDSVLTVSDLGFGFLKVKVTNDVHVVNKSGFTISVTGIEDARLIAQSFIAIEKNDRWGLYAFNGLELLPPQYQNISSIDDVVILQRTDKIILVKVASIVATADRNKLSEDLVFDEVKTWGTGNLWVRNGALEGVLDQELRFIIPFDRHRLTKTAFGFIQEKEGKLRIKGVSPALESQTFDRVLDFGNWLELDRTTSRSLYHRHIPNLEIRDLDSVWMQNRILFTTKRDSLLLLGPSGKVAAFAKLASMHFINSRDSSVFFYVQEKNRKVIYEAGTGKKYFTLDVEDIEHLGGGYFLASKNKKKGVLAADGSWLLSPQYDAIVHNSANTFSLYREKKFGLYLLHERKLIKPIYERNLLPYSSSLLIAFQNGAYGLLAKDEKPVTGFDFDEIRYWNDSSALVRKNFFWSIYELKEGKHRIDHIRQFEILTSGEEMILKVQRENYYGVISNRTGTIIPPNFTDIINVGADEQPLYFTEKRVEEADIYVVIYYDHNGKFLRKQVYESEEYERIVCEDN